MKLTVSTAALILVATQALTASAAAHQMPWRLGESRVVEFGNCAKGACMKRATFDTDKPHHHHGETLIVGSFLHNWDCHLGRQDELQSRVR